MGSSPAAEHRVEARAEAKADANQLIAFAKAPPRVKEQAAQEGQSG